MKDRLPLYPGRVKLTPVSGQANVYDMTRADQPTQEGDPLNKATLLKDATAALFGLGTDAVPDDVLALLSKAALYKSIMPTTQIGSLPEGTTIYLNENGVPVQFYIAKKNYEPNYNTNRVLVVRKEAVKQGAWNTSGANTYNGSTIDTWMNGQYFQTLDSDVRSAIGKTNIPATSPYNSGVIRLNKGVFALSYEEVGLTFSDYTNKANSEGTILPISSKLNPAAVWTWTRSPNTYDQYSVWVVPTSGNPFTYVYTDTSPYYLPAFTLPSNFTINTQLEPDSGLYDVSDNLLLKLPGVKIATGSYVGTGKYGSSNPNSLTFEFEPKLVIVQLKTANGYSQYAVFVFNGVSPFVSGDSYTINQSIDGNTLKWYTTGYDSSAQLNSSGQPYIYIALG